MAKLERRFPVRKGRRRGGEGRSSIIVGENVDGPGLISEFEACLMQCLKLGIVVVAAFGGLSVSQVTAAELQAASGPKGQRRGRLSVCEPWGQRRPRDGRQGGAARGRRGLPVCGCSAMTALSPGTKHPQL